MRPLDRRNRIRTLLAQGISAAQIAEELGCTPSTVHRIKSGEGTRKGNRAAYVTVCGKVTTWERDGLDRLVRSGKAPTRAALLRKLTRAANDFYDPSPEEEAFLKQAEVHLRALGGNFNQIATALSASMKKIGRADPSADQVTDLRAAKQSVEEIRSVIGAMLHNMQVKTETLQDRLAGGFIGETLDE